MLTSIYYLLLYIFIKLYISQFQSQKEKKEQKRILNGLQLNLYSASHHALVAC